MALGYYRALLIQDEGDGPENGYGVVFPDLPGCTSAGDTRMQAAKQAAEALELHIAGMIEDGQELPSPSDVGSPLPDWLDEASHVAGEVLVPVELPGKVVRANITVDEALLARIDGVARATGNTRSGFLAEAAQLWLRLHKREWADRRAADMRRQLHLLRSGEMRSFENKGAGEVDTTARDIERIEGWLAELATLPWMAGAEDIAP